LKDFLSQKSFVLWCVSLDFHLEKMSHHHHHHERERELEKEREIRREEILIAEMQQQQQQVNHHPHHHRNHHEREVEREREIAEIRRQEIIAAELQQRQQQSHHRPHHHHHHETAKERREEDIIAAQLGQPFPVFAPAVVMERRGKSYVKRFVLSVIMLLFLFCVSRQFHCTFRIAPRVVHGRYAHAHVFHHHGRLDYIVPSHVMAGQEVCLIFSLVGWSLLTDTFDRLNFVNHEVNLFIFISLMMQSMVMS
jgi:hypothetical protein